MKPKTEITIPDEILKEIEAYSKAENITLIEFVIWALGEKVDELRGRRGGINEAFRQIKPDRIPEGSIRPTIN